ncbi:MAG: hypothetical protein QF464_15095, partial [Myxococcota bacterium]|nr:hypothetical protein [Myxococcota bacterium]
STGLGPTSAAIAQTVEDAAGQMLYEAGKKAFEARRYEAATERFEKALSVAFGGEIQTAHKGLLNMLGRSYAKLGRCAEALPMLVVAETDEAPLDFATARTSAEVGCRRALAEAAIDEDRCEDAMRHLERLDGRVSGPEELWRQSKVAHCLPRLTVFDTSTPGRVAAYELVQAARAERDHRRLDRAAELYRKALAMVDDAQVRVELARVLLAGDDCRGALQVLEPLAEDAIPAPLRTEERRCREGATLPLAAGDEAGGGMATGGWISLGSGVALTTLAGVFAALYAKEDANQQTRYERHVTSGMTHDQALGQADVLDAQNTAYDHSIGAFVSGGLALAALGAGIVMLLVAPIGGAAETAGVGVTPLFGPTSAGLMVRF